MGTGVFVIVVGVRVGVLEGVAVVVDVVVAVGDGVAVMVVVCVGVRLIVMVMGASGELAGAVGDASTIRASASGVVVDVGSAIRLLSARAVASTSRLLPLSRLIRLAELATYSSTA